MPNERKIINIGILAHVDAGKTSITERFLHKSGAIKNLGSVDKGTSQSDSLAVEQERGISVRSSSASFKWADTQINLIDTPGHTDFSAEVERSLRALDCAILVLSAVEGVQAHTNTLWTALQRINIPTLIFINKIDRQGSDTEAVILDIGKELSENIIIFHQASNEGGQDCKILDYTQIRDIGALPEQFSEAIINQDEALMESYINAEEIDMAQLFTSMRRQISLASLFPVLLGSAKFDIGIDELLTAITAYLPVARQDIQGDLSGIIYKIEHDKNIGRLASVRLFMGTVKNRDSVFNMSAGKEEKLSQIRKSINSKLEDIGQLDAGDIGILCGLTTARAGDIIGNNKGIPEAVSLSTPLLTVKLEAEKEADYAALVKAMQLLGDEDPNIDLLWLKEERELHIKIMGIIQLEILEKILQQRFQLKVSFGDPSVIYKEMPASSGEGYEAYTMPKPCWAVLRFKIEAGTPGSGLTYDSKIGVNQIARRYQQEIERSLPIALKQGMHGWEVTDIKITLIDGEHHNIHSRAGDFAVATPMAIMNGLRNMGTVLLEPFLAFRISGPTDSMGKVISSLTQVRAHIGNPEIHDDSFILIGEMPVATTLDYATKLNSLSGGMAKLATHFNGYRPCPLELGASTPFRGISPLDRAKYILKARKAIQ